ncbi:MAG TPA: hypothetical protein VLD38_02360 [Nitrosopumilaceae archaeon]|nr:hypothetical protein [Nitrosopumilaceae archaeon]
MEQSIELLKPEYAIQEGMLFVRITDILTMMVKAPFLAVCFLLITLQSIPQYTFATSKVLDFTIDADGTTHVFYQSEIDPLQPDFTTKLFGTNIDNLVVQDENDLLLSSQIDKNKVVIETLGASQVKIEYDTADLVTKNGKIWSFSIDSPSDYSILLPKNTVIVGMDAFPLNMQVVDEQSLLSLPSGTAEINYVFGVLGTTQTATLAIEKTRDLIDKINGEEIKTPLASAKLEEAISAFNESKFSSAEILANEAKNIAIQEQQQALSNPGTKPNNDPLSFIGGTIVTTAATIGTVAGAVITISILIKRAKSAIKKTVNLLPTNEKIVTPDKETIFRLKPELRQDDKDIVAYISENGGQVYESELRKKFLLPRTTTWRAVKRLEREGVVEIEKKDQQNLIKLRTTTEENQE